MHAWSHSTVVAYYIVVILASFSSVTGVIDNHTSDILHMNTNSVEISSDSFFSLHEVYQNLSMILL
jgi:hypothetical protein